MPTWLKQGRCWMNLWPIRETWKCGKVLIDTLALWRKSFPVAMVVLRPTPSRCRGALRLIQGVAGSRLLQSHLRSIPPCGCEQLRLIYFARYIEGLGKEGDALLAIVFGDSMNMIKAAEPGRRA